MTQSGNNITVNSGTMTATAFYESSDLKLKTVIERYSSIDGIDTVKFIHNEDPNRERIGYIAQEVNDILPSAVAIDRKGFMKVDYKDIQAWKIMELNKRIEKLENILTKL
jgi:hypothetical protein